MRVRPLLAAAVVLSLSPLAFAADAMKGMWDGCGEGSWVQTKTTSKTVMTGMNIPENVSESRQMLVKVTDAAWTVKSEQKVGDGWAHAHEMSLPRIAMTELNQAAKDAVKYEELGTEAVTVEGKEYPCKKTKTVVGGMTGLAWTSAEHGALKSESGSAGGMQTLMQVTSLSKTVKVGGKDIVCRESKTTTKGPGADMTMVSLSSTAVPTHTVRSEMTTAMGAMKSVAVTEVVAFEVK